MSLMNGTRSLGEGMLIENMIRYAHYAPHSHAGLTTHLIRRGSLTITYPKDVNPTKQTFSVGARIDVPAGKVHEVWMGEEGK